MSITRSSLVTVHPFSPSKVSETLYFPYRFIIISWLFPVNNVSRSGPLTVQLKMPPESASDFKLTSAGIRQEKPLLMLTLTFGSGRIFIHGLTTSCTQDPIYFFSFIVKHPGMLNVCSGFISFEVMPSPKSHLTLSAR